MSFASSFPQEQELADKLSRLLQRLGIITYVTVQDYKESPGGPVLELMLTPADAFKLQQALEGG